MAFVEDTTVKEVSINGSSTVAASNSSISSNQDEIKLYEEFLSWYLLNDMGMYSGYGWIY